MPCQQPAGQSARKICLCNSSIYPMNLRRRLRAGTVDLTRLRETRRKASLQIAVASGTLTSLLNIIGCVEQSQLIETVTVLWPPCQYVPIARASSMAKYMLSTRMISYMELSMVQPQMLYMLATRNFPLSGRESWPREPEKCITHSHRRTRRETLHTPIARIDIRDVEQRTS
jgi:hypothetical protein